MKNMNCKYDACMHWNTGLGGKKRIHSLWITGSILAGAGGVFFFGAFFWSFLSPLGFGRKITCDTPVGYALVGGWVLPRRI